MNSWLRVQSAAHLPLLWRSAGQRLGPLSGSALPPGGGLVSFRVFKFNLFTKSIDGTFLARWVGFRETQFGEMRSAVHVRMPRKRKKKRVLRVEIKSAEIREKDRYTRLGFTAISAQSLNIYRGK